MATVDVTIAVGNYAEAVFYGCVDSAGYLIGSTATAPAAGAADGSKMAQLVGVQDFPFQPQPSDRPTQLGDSGALARFLNRPTELPEADFTHGASDFDFYALSQGLVVNNTGGGMFVMGQPYNPVYQDLILMVYSAAKSLESGNTGSMYEGRIILLANVQARGRDTFNTNALPTYGYSLVANYATAFPWGHAFTATDEGDTSAVFLDFTWPYPPIIERWTGNNVLVTFNLGKDIAEDSADNIIVFVNGVASTWVTGAPGAGEFGITEGATDTLVFGTAPPASAKVVAMYGWK